MKSHSPVNKILVAPDSFKDCLSSEEVARFLAEGIKEADNLKEAGTNIEAGVNKEAVNLKEPGTNIEAGTRRKEINIFPVADGGEGTVSCIRFHRGGTWKELNVSDPLHRLVKSGYLVLDDEKTAVIEMASASGLELLKPEERNALKTSSHGTGELIRDALDSGLRRIILTIGGSATVDGGTGIAAALGFRFLDENDQFIDPVRGGNLTDICHINRDNVIFPFGEKKEDGQHGSFTSKSAKAAGTEIIIACDVQNVLNGQEGAARVYGPQKGADERAVVKLEEGLANLSALVREDTGFDADKHPGTGAAGGAALFLLAYGGGVLKGGFDIISELTGFTDAVRDADLVITGEGRIDTQTAYGKVVASIAAITAREKKQLILVGGILDGDKQELKERYGAEEVYSLSELAGDQGDSIKNAATYLKETARRIYILTKCI